MIKVEGLTKQYIVPKKEYKKNIFTMLNPPKEKIYGLKEVSFEIEQGEFVGLVGLNGAGKTTLIKTLSGILTPTDGTVEILGYTPSLQRKQYTREISVIMGQKSVLFYELPVIESFKFYKDVYGVDNLHYKEKMKMLSRCLEMEELLHIPVRKLSLGQRMRCEIGVALLHEPRIIFLDEPTLGLDIISKRAILQLLGDLNEQFHTTVILTTHDVEDISNMCERLIILEHGKIIYDGKTSEFSERKKYKILKLSCEGVLDLKDIETLICERKYEDNKELILKIEAVNLFAVIEYLMRCKQYINDFSINTISLTQVLYELYDE